MAEQLSVLPYKQATEGDQFSAAKRAIGLASDAQQLEQGGVNLDKSKLELAATQIAQMRGLLGSLAADSDLGKSDISSKIQDAAVQAVRLKLATPEQSAELLRGVPRDPTQQHKWVMSHMANMLSATEKLNAFLGPVSSTSTGGGTRFTQTPQFPGLPSRDRGSIESTLPPGTQTPGPRNQPVFLGQPGVGELQQGPDSVRQVPGQPMSILPQRQAAPPPELLPGAQPGSWSQGARPAGKPPVAAAAAPGDVKTQETSAASYSSELEKAGNYAQRINPLRQAIPLIRGMKETDIGPGSERLQDVKSFLQTLGAGRLANIDPEKIQKYNEVKKYLTAYASQQAQGMGPHTNDGLAQAVASNPNMSMDKLSVEELTKIALGLERYNHAAIREFNQLVRTQQASPDQWQSFKADWATKNDPRAFVYDLLDGKAQKRIRDELSDAKKEEFRETMRRADRMGIIGDVRR